MAGPVKRSVNIAGHATSITLEPIFWEALVRAAGEEGVPLNALVARIDAERVEADDLPNLASAIRVWLFRRATGRETSESLDR
ncbi:ribbon-helix-helix domain-containing protein [Rhizorhabdus dicambivorans]|uniref:Aryl-sulfate sulfotransferase n=1 Tax=Rhizorhabdus dicambivorans TaxID=1850238 RepID=A0A2A4FTA2_9SPHN|nr:ribbon-helix-helix domain-containing protein [Rhizorhabdus dicambivorans]ATE65619.1 aryl-sulfate sulfotransferase [Rhizorhabdus dicambivorans]PCE40960.1 aryl-sulfate sulfotransferase [Rhizorhabdus dicambivorans]